MRLTLLLAVALLSPCVQAQRPAAGTIVAGDLGKRLETVVADKAEGYWGAVLVAVAGKPVLARGYGMADRGKIPNGPASLFDLGGTTQQLTALLVLRLCAEKKLRFDDPVRKYLPEWPADRAAITIDHLLHHTSGLSGEASWAGGAANASRTASEAIGRAKLVGPPGGTHQYSYLNAIALALVLENALQGRFDKILTERVQKAFGMTGAGPCNGRFDSRHVTARRTPENERGEPATAFELNWVHRGVRGVLASVTDVHALLGALCDGKLLDDFHLELLWRPVLGGELYTVAVLPAGTERVVRIAGQAPGYRWRWIVHRASRTWIVLATEDFGSTEELEMALLAELAQHVAGVSAQPQPAEPAPEPVTPAAAGTGGAPLDAATIERFVGTFTMPGGGGTLRLAVDAGELRLQGSGLQASARLTDGAWLEHHSEKRRHAEDRGLLLVERLVGGDEEKAADGFATREQARDAVRLVAAWLGRHRPSRTEFVGTELSDQGEPAHSWFRLCGNGGELLLRAAWHDAQRFGACSAATTEPPFSAPVQVVRADCAVARTPLGGELRLTIEGRGSARVLVFEDGTPGGTGLLDCPLAAGR